MLCVSGNGWPSPKRGDQPPKDGRRWESGGRHVWQWLFLHQQWTHRPADWQHWTPEAGDWLHWPDHLHWAPALPLSQGGYEPTLVTRWLWTNTCHKVGMNQPLSQSGYEPTLVTRWVWTNPRHKVGMNQPSSQGGYEPTLVTRWVWLWTNPRHKVGMNQHSSQGGYEPTLVTR